MSSLTGSHHLQQSFEFEMSPIKNEMRCCADTMSGGCSGTSNAKCSGAMNRAPTLYSNVHDLEREERYMEYLRKKLNFQASIPRGYCCPPQCKGANTSNCSPNCNQSVPKSFHDL
jgi:hypothetical protein